MTWICVKFVALCFQPPLQFFQITARRKRLVECIEKNGSYVTEINGFTQGDYTDTTGWVFTVNGEMPDVGAGEITVEEGDKIAWNFIDFSTYPW